MGELAGNWLTNSDASQRIVSPGAASNDLDVKHLCSGFVPIFGTSLSPAYAKGISMKLSEKQDITIEELEVLHQEVSDEVVAALHRWAEIKSSEWSTSSKLMLLCPVFGGLLGATKHFAADLDDILGADGQLILEVWESCLDIMKTILDQLPESKKYGSGTAE